jgi:hypothetical protein
MAGWSTEVTFLLSTGCTKCSILFFYRRLTKGSYNRRWKYTIIAAIAATALYSAAFILMLIFACSPTDAYWKSFNPYYEGDFTYINSKYSNVLSGAMSVTSDLWSVLLPCLMLRNFDAPRRQKIALNLIFSLGLLVVAAGSVRTYYLEELGHSVDLTWTGYDVLIWAQLETQLSLICASAPALRVLFRTYLSGSMIRVLSSARSHSRPGPRRQSKKLCGKSSDSCRGESPIPLKTTAAEKPGTLTSSVEEELTAVPALHSKFDKRMDTALADFEHVLRSLEDNRPPVAYPLRGK